MIQWVRGRAEIMYETLDNLRIKARAGVESAALELKARMLKREEIRLQGLKGMKMYLIPTEELWERIASIESLYQNVSNKNKVKDILLLDAYHSATIEGARTTVEHVKKAWTDPKTKDDKMVMNTLRGLNYAYENTITLENLRFLWEIVTKDVCENKHLDGECYRNGMVYVGSASEIVHTPAKPSEIPHLMEALFTFLTETEMNVWIAACIFHFYFVYVHPYCDGNGRMARILTQSFLFFHGKKKIKFLPLSRAINDSLSGYYATLKQSENVQSNGEKWLDITPFIDYMLGAIENCIVTAMREYNECKLAIIV